MTRQEAIDKVYGMSGTKEQHEALEFLIPEVRELREFYERQQEDERIRSGLVRSLESDRDCQPCQDISFYEEAIAWLKKQKEQKPAESISQLTVQGKGVYKICPRCKERMVRDDSMVYTSMPPQYRYECPKCGESECDTVMYDNPEMEEQKPVVTHGETYHVDTLGTQQVIAGKMPQKPAEWTLPKDFEEAVYKVANFISPFDSQEELRKVSHRFAEQLMSLAKKELDKSAEWSGEDERMLQLIIKDFRAGNVSSIGQEQWLKSLPERFNLQPKQEWSEEDEMYLSQAIETLVHENYLILAEKLKSLRPHWKPSEEQMEEMEFVINDYREDGCNRLADCLQEILEQMKKL